MKSIEVLSTGIRLVGFYAIVIGLRTASYHYYTVSEFLAWDRDNTLVSGFLYMSLAAVLFIFLAAFIMIKFPLTIAKKLLPSPVENESEAAGPTSGLEVALYSVLGIFILSWAIPDFVNNFIWIWYLKSDASAYTSSAAEHFINQAVTLVELLIGIYLALRAKGLYMLLCKLRGLGAPEVSDVA